MASNQIGIAIFGAGRWGTHLIRNFLQLPQARLVAIADPNIDRLQALTQRFDLNRVVLEPDWQLAMSLSDIEAVVIATPASTHYQLTQTALQLKHHVLVEKPLALNWQAAIELCELAERQQRQLVVDHTYLFHAAVQCGKSRIQQQQLGEIYYGYAARTHLSPVRRDVDVLWDLGIHDIGIFNHWLDQIPIHVQAQGTVWLPPEQQTRGIPGLADLVWATLIYPNSVQVRLHLCWANPDKQRRLCLVGDRGTLVFDELTALPLVLQHGKLAKQNRSLHPIEQNSEAIAVDSGEPLQAVCCHFLDCVQHNRPSSISSGWVGVQLVQILEALTRSLHQNGQLVRVDQPFS